MLATQRKTTLPLLQWNAGKGRKRRMGDTHTHTPSHWAARRLGDGALKPSPEARLRWGLQTPQQRHGTFQMQHFSQCPAPVDLHDPPPPPRSPLNQHTVCPPRLHALRMPSYPVSRDLGGGAFSSRYLVASPHHTPTPQFKQIKAPTGF